MLECVLVLSFMRLRFGMDFNDESFYAVVTQRFALGDRPFVDEINLRQTASVLTTPLYWLWLQTTGSTDGVIYFLRLVFFGLQVVVAWAAYRFATTCVSRAYAVLVAAVPVAFIPFLIPTCSYNTLGTLLFTLGSLLGMTRLLAPGSGRSLGAAGFVHALACVAYPPLALPVLLFGVAVHLALSSEPGAGPRLRYAYLVGMLPAALLVGGFLLPHALAGLDQALGYESALTRERGFTKLTGLLLTIVLLSPWFPVFPVALVGATFVAKRAPPTAPYLASLLLAGSAWWCSIRHPELEALLRPDTLSHHMAIDVSLLGASFLWLARPGPTKKVLWWAGWFPSAVAALVMGMASDNYGPMNAGLGFLPAALVSLVLPARALSPDAGPAWSKLALSFALAFVPLRMEVNNYSYAYGDVAPLDADAVVRTGPFRGIRTRREGAVAAETITREVRALVRPGERMLVYYDFPAAYLMAGARPALQTSWSDQRANYAALLPYYARERTGKGVVLRLARHRDVSPELEALIEVPARLLVDGKWYRFYREPPP